MNGYLNQKKRQIYRQWYFITKKSEIPTQTVNKGCPPSFSD